jgi:adenylate kinase
VVVEWVAWFGLGLGFADGVGRRLEGSAMRAIVTGQVGMDKKPYLDAVARLAGQQGERLEVYHVGDIMYKEAPDVRPGRILDLPLSRLNSLRRAAVKDVIAESRGVENVVVNTHATFRWRHGLFSAFDFDQVAKLEPDLFICLVDNIEVVHKRLHDEHDIDATLKDCMVWREEEILATELLSQALPGSRFYIVSRGRHAETVRTMFRLVCRPEMRKVYPSFPMSHVVDMPEVMAEIDAFRAALSEHFVTFDPGDVDEKLLLDRALAAVKEGKDFFDHMPHQLGGVQRQMEPIRMRTREVLDIAGDIDGQIYMRDFKLIDQADMIVSFVPELTSETGKIIPGLSSGVERELQHAWEHAKEVYVVWKPAKAPSPFITETSTKIFRSVEEALAYFEGQGMFAAKNLFGQ